MSTPRGPSVPEYPMRTRKSTPCVPRAPKCEYPEHPMCTQSTPCEPRAPHVYPEYLMRAHTTPCEYPEYPMRASCLPNHASSVHVAATWQQRTAAPLQSQCARLQRSISGRTAQHQRSTAQHSVAQCSIRSSKSSRRREQRSTALRSEAQRSGSRRRRRCGRCGLTAKNSGAT